MRILLDMDGVVCDFLTPLIQQYNHLTNEKVDINKITTCKTAKFVKKRGVLFNIKDSPGFIRYLEPISGALEGVELLHEAGHEVVFVSNATNCPTSAHEKREWLKYYFGHLWKIPKLILTYHKYLVKGDLLLEDNPEQLERLEEDVMPVLFHQHYNASENRFRRVYGWDGFLELIGELNEPNG